MNDQMTTFARPYAFAAFAEAKAGQEKQYNGKSLADIPAWGNMLQAAAAITSDARVQVLLSAPHQQAARIARFYCDVLGDSLSQQQANFIRLLAEYSRLPLLPEIARLFHLQRETFENTRTVKVKSAITLGQEYSEKLASVLARRLGQKISLACEVDESLLGGIVVTAGDLVMDGSVRGKLDRLIHSVSGQTNELR